MIRGGFAAFVIALWLAAFVGASAQSSFVSQYYDTSRTETLTGRIASVVLQDSQHTFLLLDVAAGADKAERWAVEGRPAAELGWMGRSAPVRLGDTVTVVVYRAKPGSKVAAIVPADHARLVETATAGRLVHGTELTLPDGSKVAFGER
jgi:hypothetical protein